VSACWVDGILVVLDRKTIDPVTAARTLLSSRLHIYEIEGEYASLATRARLSQLIMSKQFPLLMAEHSCQPPSLMTPQPQDKIMTPSPRQEAFTEPPF
jgi:hypothetical protein